MLGVVLDDIDGIELSDLTVLVVLGDELTELETE